MSSVCACPQCGTRYRAGGLRPGRRLRCRKCRTVFTFHPSADGSPAQEAALPAGNGDSSSLDRAGFKGGVSLGTRSVNEPQLAGDAERYTVEDEIARGGMGQILRVTDRHLRREVAMKVMLDAMDEKDRARFVQEAQVTAQLEHPNIVPVHELGIDAEGRLFFTMKLVKGRSLAEILKGLREKPEEFREYTLGRLLSVFVNICNAIAFAHSKGVVHRDLKPANLMVGDYGEVLVMDWGLAKVGGAKKTATARREVKEVSEPSANPNAVGLVTTGRVESSGGLTVDGAVMGTPFYMPPEQAAGEIGKIDERSDIYSLGAILYEILTLKPLIEGTTLPVILKNVIEGNIRPPEVRSPDRPIPPELSAVAMKALARRQEDRYATAEALRRDIELFLEGRAVSAKPDTAWETLVKVVRRNRGVSIAAALGLGVALTLAAVSYWINLREKFEAQRQRERAEGSERTALANQNRAERALADLKAEQELRVLQQKTGAGAILKRALGAVERKDFDAALTDAEIAVAFDPDLAEARLLRAELMIFKKEYSRAQNDLAEYARLKPEDASGRRLLDLCTMAIEGKESQATSGLADEFMRRRRWTFAEAFTKDREELFAIYKGRVAAAWPGSEQNLTMDAEGGCTLSLSDLELNDLSPLEGIPIHSLFLTRSTVADLSPIARLPIKTLHLGDTKVTDLGPLSRMPLESLDIGNTQISDLSPLRGRPLKSLQANAAPIQDLSPLRGMALEGLYLNGCKKITDLSPLIGMNLKRLSLCDNGVRDLRPLENVKVENLAFWPNQITQGIEVLRNMKSLKSISLQLDMSAAMAPDEFWKRYDAGEFK